MSLTDLQNVVKNIRVMTNCSESILSFYYTSFFYHVKGNNYQDGSYHHCSFAFLMEDHFDDLI